MAIQVCRTGNQGQYEKTFYENSAIYYTRDGFDFDLAQSSKDVVISRLSELMKDAARQTISNTWSQIDIFSHRMNVGDIVIVPKKNSPITAVGIISSQYRYKPDDMFPQKHTRSVDYIAFDIEKKKPLEFTYAKSRMLEKYNERLEKLDHLCVW